MIRALFLFILVPTSLIAQENSGIEGEWNGFININGQELTISLTFMNTYDELDGSIDIPQQNAFNLPVEVTLSQPDSLEFEFQTGTGSAVFNASLNNPSPDSINGMFTQSGMTFPFSLQRNGNTASTDSRLNQQEITIELEDQQIQGSLVTPPLPKSSSLIIMISGSGASPRNSPVAGFEVFKELAVLLSDGGYHSFRFDDPAVGGSTGNADATLQDLAADVEEIITYFRENEEHLFDEIILLGHSQGGIIASLAAQNNDLSGLILMASPSFTGEQIINQQIRKISDVEGIPEEIVEENLEFQEKIYEVVKTNGDWEEIEADLENRLREQINQLPERQQEALGDMNEFIESQIDRQLGSAKSRWFKSFLETDPLAALNQTDEPILAIFGGKDSQVLSEPNEAALPEDSRITKVILPDANHLFQKAETGMTGEYPMLDKQFIEGFAEELLRFLNQE
ncbi:MAG: alpha/beta fold hydrolase [Balneolaceae bacterium]